MLILLIAEHFMVYPLVYIYGMRHTSSIEFCIVRDLIREFFTNLHSNRNYE